MCATSQAAGHDVCKNYNGDLPWTEEGAVKVHASLSNAKLAAYTAGQLNNLCPDETCVSHDDLLAVFPRALERLEHCFSAIENKYFFDGTHAVFNHLHGDQYAMWLYFLANELHLQKAPAEIPAKLFLLNKMLHGCDIFYEVDLPSIFLLVHPLGTVLGRGNYSDYFVAYQRCGVGSNHDVYPTLGKHVTLRPGSSVLGRSVVGDNCQIASDGLVIDRDVAANTVFMGRPGQIREVANKGPYPLWRSGPERQG